MAIIRNNSQIAGIQLSASGNAAGVVLQHKTTTEMNAASTPATGSVIFNTTDNQYYTFNGTAWASAKGSSGGGGAAGGDGGDGDRGTKGGKGTAGLQGATGAKGDANNTTGATGDTGSTGSKGATGAQGYHGGAGGTGNAGARGSRSGGKGPGGDTGYQGYHGATNNQGGSQGPTGPRGPKGSAGYTGYMGGGGGGGGTGNRGSRSGGKGPTGYQGNTGGGGGASTNQNMQTGANVQLLQLGIGTGSIPGRMRIARMVTDAVVFINGTPTGFQTVGGGNTGQVYRAHNYGGTDRHYVSRNGQYYHSGNRTSDARLKKDIEEYSGSVLSNIDQFQPKQFYWKPDEASTNRKLGFIAQDYTASKFNELITGKETDVNEVKGESGTTYSGSFGFNYDGATSILVKAVSESLQLIDNLKTRLTTLESG
jgi:hypothetical protein